MNKLAKVLVVMTLFLMLFSCKTFQPVTITVKNILPVPRAFETVELTADFLKVEDVSNLGVFNTKTKVLQITQTVDSDGDGVADVLLFQPEISANTSQTYEILKITAAAQPKAPELCYSRFVPERTDDYAWENNKVAFRVFGPTAQQLKESNQPNGTLSSGVDAWLKRVDYPIINKWYKKYTDGTGSYHKDTGEGLDNFHVGVSRGIGGIAVKKDSSYHYSKNFTEWKTITNGPIRTSFYLAYENWDAAGNVIKESRIISLDKGNNLSKFSIHIQGTTEIAVGLTLHDKKGSINGHQQKGWVSYWEPIGDSEIGSAIVAKPKYFIDYETYISEKRDESNVYANLKVFNNIVEYYAGFGWKKSKQFKNENEWIDYLDNFSDKINNPLIITINK